MHNRVKNLGATNDFKLDSLLQARLTSCRLGGPSNLRSLDRLLLAKFN